MKIPSYSNLRFRVMSLLLWSRIPLKKQDGVRMKELACTGTCSPVLQPEARWGDIWGMGWLNFHSRLVREVKRADDKEVRTELCTSTQYPYHGTEGCKTLPGWLSRYHRCSA